MPRNLLLEAGFLCLPDNLQASSLSDLRQPVCDVLEREKISFSRVKCWLSQHRTGILIEGLSDSLNESVKEVRGPKASGAYDFNNQLSPAAKGFAAAQGVEYSSLVTREVDGEKYLFAVKTTPGQPIERILPDLTRNLLVALYSGGASWSEKSIFPQPPVSFCAMLDDCLVPFKFEGIDSEDCILLWNGLKPQKIKVAHAAEYVRIMNENGLNADAVERRKTFEAKIRAILPDGYLLRSDHSRTARICSCSESMQPIFVKIPAKALELPETVVHRQIVFKCGYLACEDQRGKLLPAAIAFSEQTGNASEEALLLSKKLELQFDRLLDIWTADSLILTDKINKISNLTGPTFPGRVGKCAELLSEWLLSEKDKMSAGLLVEMIEAAEETRLAGKLPDTGFSLILSCLPDKPANAPFKAALQETCSYFSGRIPAPKNLIAQIISLAILLQAFMQPRNRIYVSTERIINFLRASGLKIDLFALIKGTFPENPLDSGIWINCSAALAADGEINEFISESFFNTAEFDVVSFCELLREIKELKSEDVDSLNSIYYRIKGRIEETAPVASTDYPDCLASEIGASLDSIEQFKGIPYEKILEFFNQQKVNIEACLINLPSVLDDKKNEHLPRISIMQRLVKQLGRLPFIQKDRSGARKIA